MITSERSERNTYYLSYMGRLDYIQTALKPFKKSRKTEIIYLYLFQEHRNNEPARPSPSSPARRDRNAF